MSAMGKLIEDWTKKVCTCLAMDFNRARAACGCGSRAKLTLKDGPFSDVENLVSGYAVVQTKSKAEAIELAKVSLKSSAAARARSARCSRFSVCQTALDDVP